MKVVITGVNGFVGSNLRVRLAERSGWNVDGIGRNEYVGSLVRSCARADVIIHLAGANRPPDPSSFMADNRDATRQLCDVLVENAARTGHRPRVIYASSIQASMDNAYGLSKRAAEKALRSLSETHGHEVHIFRLPNVFGKWCRPHYNSVVATFCHQVARGFPIEVHDPSAPLELIHIDDVVASFLSLLDGARPVVGSDGFNLAGPVYSTTVGRIAEIITSFRESRQTGIIGTVGYGLGRALYSTYVSHLPIEDFCYPIASHDDPRGRFVEMLKTEGSGQFSFFTANPGVTRGGHYHHTKTEKFLVLRGQARFRFRHVLTGQAHELLIDAEVPQIVETIPGWAHDITNIGNDLMYVMLWANEVFDRRRPDTISADL